MRIVKSYLVRDNYDKLNRYEAVELSAQIVFF